MSEIKFFNKWSSEDIIVEDPGLKDYISLKPKLVPKTGARYVGNRFHKSQISIVERLINKVMVPGHGRKKHQRSSGHNTGKGQNALKLVEDAFTYIEGKLNKNPILVLVKAIENAAPREEIITIEYGGAKYPKAVEMSPQRRIDFSLRLMTQGAHSKSFNKKNQAYVCLADEIINAYQMDKKSVAISKKLELERQADSTK